MNFFGYWFHFVGNACRHWCHFFIFWFYRLTVSENVTREELGQEGWRGEVMKFLGGNSLKKHPVYLRTEVMTRKCIFENKGNDTQK